MANEEAVSRAIGYLQGALGRSTLPKDDTKKVWSDAFGDVSDADLEQAVKWYAKDTTERKWPLPVEILAVVRKVEGWRYGQDLQQDECRLCSGRGLILGPSSKRSGVTAMRPCTCGLGKSKARYLGSERKAGRAWTSDRLKKTPAQEEPARQQSTEPTAQEESQEEIPF